MLLTNDMILEAIEKLPKDKKSEVYDFIKFLLNRTKKVVGKKDIHELLSVSVWTDSDVSKITSAQKEISRWEVQEY